MRKKNSILKRLMAVLLLITVLTGSFGVMQVQAATNNQRVEIKQSGQVVDTFNGVPARYIKEKSNSGTYSCAGYVKAYYKAIYGVDVYNLLETRMPLVQQQGYSFVETASPQPGDIVRENGGKHWAICKSVSGSTVTLIEQNWKWSEGSSVYTKVNRTVSKSSVTFYKLTGKSSSAGKSAHVVYSGHVQNIGDVSAVSDWSVLGTEGLSLRLEWLDVRVEGMSGGVSINGHVQNYGWMGYQNGYAGTKGQSLRLEAVRLKLYGEVANYYDIEYRVHIQNKGWSNVCRTDQVCGTTGESLRIEAIQIRLVRK